MIEEINQRKTAKNLLQGYTCEQCAFFAAHISSINYPTGNRINICRLCDENTELENSCMFWSSSEENMYEYIKENGLVFQDIQEMWFK